MHNTAFHIDEVADWLLSRQAMPPKKLQKLLYYEYVWFLVYFNDEQGIDNRLFDERFQAWPQGPVNPKIYREYESYGFDDIPVKKSNLAEKTNEDVLDIIQQVYDVYGRYDGDQLENNVHKEAPWRIARGDKRPLDKCTDIINDKDIFSYYVQALF